MDGSKHHYCLKCHKVLTKGLLFCSNPDCGVSQEPRAKQNTDKKFPCNDCKCTLNSESAKFHICPGKPIEKKTEEPRNDRRSDRREFREDDRRYREQSYDNRASRRDEEERNRTRPSDERKYFNQPEDRRYREQNYDNRVPRTDDEERNRSRHRDRREYYNQPETGNGRAYEYIIRTEYVIRRKSKDR
jgi:hypothetical protein